MGRLNVLLIDDHPIIHVTLEAVVRTGIPGAQVHPETTLAGALECAGRLPDLGLVLLDLGLPGCTGLEALHRFREAFPGPSLVVISATDDAGTVEAAIAAGAAGYLPKSSAPSLMVAALKLVLSGGTYVPPQVMNAPRPPRARKLASTADLGLTGRQREVLRLLMTAMPYDDIARELRIPENTVEQHAHAVFKKLGVASRSEALIVLARLGLRLD